MEFRFNINEVFKSPIVEITQNLIPPGYTGDRRALWDAVSKVGEIVNQMGVASAAAQGLSKPITTADRLRNSEHKLYFLVEQKAHNGKGAVTGMLKTGNKSLYVFDREGNHYQVQPPCLLDFYVHESRQRNGLGKVLFEHMLQKESIEPVQLAIDRPSDKLLGFLNKHYCLKDPVKQMNNYVVFDDFFPRRSLAPIQQQSQVDGVRNKNPNSANGLQHVTTTPMGRYGAPRPPCSMGQIIHNQSPNEQRQEATGVQSMPATNYQGYQQSYSTPNPAYMTQSTPNMYYGNNYPQYQGQVQTNYQNAPGQTWPDSNALGYGTANQLAEQGVSSASYQLQTQDHNQTLNYQGQYTMPDQTYAQEQTTTYNDSYQPRTNINTNYTPYSQQQTPVGDNIQQQATATSMAQLQKISEQAENSDYAAQQALDAVSQQAAMNMAGQQQAIQQQTTNNSIAQQQPQMSTEPTATTQQEIDQEAANYVAQSANMQAQQAANYAAQAAQQQAGNVQAQQAANMQAQQAANMQAQQAANMQAQQAANMQAQQAANMQAQQAANMQAQQAANYAAQSAHKPAQQQASNVGQQAANMGDQYQAASMAAQQQAANMAALQQTTNMAAQQDTNMTAQYQSANMANLDQSANMAAQYQQAVNMAAQQKPSNMAALKQTVNVAAQQQAANMIAQQAAQHQAANMVAQQQASNITAQQQTANMIAQQAANMAAQQQAANMAAQQVCVGDQQNIMGQQVANQMASNQFAQNTNPQMAAQSLHPQYATLMPSVPAQSAYYQPVQSAHSAPLNQSPVMGQYHTVSQSVPSFTPNYTQMRSNGLEAGDIPQRHMSQYVSPVPSKPAVAANVLSHSPQIYQTQNHPSDKTQNALNVPGQAGDYTQAVDYKINQSQTQMQENQSNEGANRPYSAVACGADRFRIIDMKHKRNDGSDFVKQQNENELKNGYPPQISHEAEKKGEKSRPTKLERPKSLVIKHEKNEVSQLEEEEVDIDKDSLADSVDVGIGTEEVEAEVKEKVKVRSATENFLCAESKTPSPRKTPSHLTDQGYFDLKFYHNKLW